MKSRVCAWKHRDEFSSLRTWDQQTKQPALQHGCPQPPLSSPELYTHQPEWEGGRLLTEQPLRLGQSSPSAKWVPRRAHVARGASWALRGLCQALDRRTRSGKMIATADKWESNTESVASAWLLSTAVARETDVSLMETRISENFHLPRFHWSRQPFLWKQ